MRNKFKIVGRGSWLSLAQMEMFKTSVLKMFPNVSIEFSIWETAGDKDQSKPLHLVEGKDFFTKDIQEQLNEGKADFAVHSMKDVSNLDFFHNSYYTLIDRDMLHDVVIFGQKVKEKIERGEKIVIGTSSPRRSHMAALFLEEHLPQYNGKAANIEVKPIRGNVDKRLQQLEVGKYDGIVLAAAGINRLLLYGPSRATISSLLQDKPLMVLPLFDCPPAAGQGAIVVEASKHNAEAVAILKLVGDHAIKDQTEQERLFAQKYGYGCSQSFGTFHLNTDHVSFTYAAGVKPNGETFTDWIFDIDVKEEIASVFNTSLSMKDFFDYRFNDFNAVVASSYQSIYVGSHKAVHSASLIQLLKEKEVWVAGTKTWKHLAQEGVWVTGCADGLGLEFLNALWQSALLERKKENLLLLTNDASADRWQTSGYAALGTYGLKPKNSKILLQNISEANAIFWTSFLQYAFYKDFLKSNVVHACLPGKTYELLKAEGISPIVFPTIKAFNAWYNQHTKLAIDV